MKYTEMEKLNVKTSLLGFGCMRFPKTEDGKIEEIEAEKMLDKAIAEGVNYIDTAYPYHDGESEPFVGRVLKKYGRSSFYLATKLPIWQLKEEADAKRIFDEQLKRLDVDYVDFYLLHALDKKKWQTVKDLKVLETVLKLKEEGKIRYLGFSFHDNYDVFEEILTSRDWDFCQIQYNYMDNTIQAGDKGYELAKKLGVPMVIMEPIKGGSLVRLPEDLKSILTDYNPDASLASWALRWVGSRDNCKVVLSGMSSYEQVLDNLETFKEFKPLDENEEAVIEKLRQTIRSRQKNGCTACAYCMPCPFGVNIPKNFQYWNEAAMYQNPERLKNGYESLNEAKAEFCKKCGACERMCPQQIKIREDLQRIVDEVKQ